MWCGVLEHVISLMWCGVLEHVISLMWCSKGFFSWSQLSAQTLLWCPCSPPQVQSHASTSVRMLKILNTSSYATVWTQENTAHTSRSGQHSEALKVKLKKRKRTVHRVFIQKNLSKSTNFTQTFSQLQNPSMMPKYGTEKQHEGIQIFCTSSKGAQPFLYPNTLYQSKLTGSAFFVILHDFFFFNYCSVLGNAVSEW